MNDCLKSTTLPPGDREDGALRLPRVIREFYAAELASSHPSAVAAFMAAGIVEQLAVRAAGAICESAPLSAIAITDGTSVCVAQLPDGQFGLFCGLSAEPTTDEAAIQRDVATLCEQLGTLWVVVERHRICGFDTPNSDAPNAAGAGPGAAP